MRRFSVLVSILLAGFTQSQDITAPAADSPIALSTDLIIQKLSDNACLHISYETVANFGRVAANGLIYYKNGKAIMIDTPWTEQETGDLIAWICDTLDLELQAVVVTHWHGDCMGGLAEVHRRKIPTYSLARTADIARRKNLPVPENTFVDSLTLSIGGERCFCWFPGEGHTSDNIVVWIASEKILFAGCLVKSMDAQGAGNLTDANREAWPGTVQNIFDKFPDCRTVIPGHGNHGGTALFDHTIDLLNRVLSDGRTPGNH